MQNGNHLWDDSHRPWPIPNFPWVMKQTWSDTLFIHYPIRLETLREIVPSGLILDSYDGWGWIGILPFQMEKVGMRGLPFTIQFPELNIRTYVVVDGKPGIYFFSLDATSLPTVFLARLFIHLPYYYAKIGFHVYEHSYTFKSIRFKESAVQLDCSFNPVSEIFHAKKGSFDEWLIERYCFYSLNAKGSIKRCNILHRPWPLQRADAEIRTNTLLSPQGIFVEHEKPILHFSAGVDVRIWPLEKV